MFFNFQPLISLGKSSIAHAPKSLKNLLRPKNLIKCQNETKRGKCKENGHFLKIAYRAGAVHRVRARVFSLAVVRSRTRGDYTKVYLRSLLFHYTSFTYEVMDRL